MRRLAGSLAILWGTLPLLSPGFLVGAHALLASHDHQVSVLADTGHVDLVLSHAESHASEGPHAVEQHLHSLPASDGAHVFHLTSSDVARDSTRRGGPAEAQTACLTLSRPYSPPPAALPACRRERLALATPLLETTVLRI